MVKSEKLLEILNSYKSADMVNISMILPVNVLDVEKSRAYINNLLSA